jgi:hypothetical protein
MGRSAACLDSRSITSHREEGHADVPRESPSIGRRGYVWQDLIVCWTVYLRMVSASTVIFWHVLRYRIATLSACLSACVIDSKSMNSL